MTQTSILFFLLLSSVCLSAQESIDEIKDPALKERVLEIRLKTDSVLKKLTGNSSFKKWSPHFCTSFLRGEFYENYCSLNNKNLNPEDIYSLDQYYGYEDSIHGLKEQIGIRFLELKNRFDSAYYYLTVSVHSNEDWLKVRAINYFNSKVVQERLRQHLSLKKGKKHRVVISVDEVSNNFFVMLKFEGDKHNYSL